MSRRSDSRAKKTPSGSPATADGRRPGSEPHGGLRRFTRRWLVGIAVLLALALLILEGGNRLGLWRRAEPPENSDFPLPALSTSPFLNTRPEVAYVGSGVCRSCHYSHDISFRHTGMGRSMALLDPAKEPPDGAFDHLLSKRRYQVRRKDGQLWHRELLLSDGAEEVLLAEYPLTYVIGSGRHSRTYALAIDGFLTESPVTWYASKKSWGMSPGYDGADQPSFERPIEDHCLFCHAGRIEVQQRSLHRIRVVEAAISCERCHGPGELHVKKHQGRQETENDGIDYTIVNPDHLPRALQEAVCQQCHLQSSAMALARGRTLTDFRPGLPLEDFKHDYQLERADHEMTVVGHVEQLHLSRCYQASDRLTCLTCHDPHARAPKKGAAAQTASCLVCHNPDRCKADKAERTRTTPADNCVECHMPRSPTDIPHLAFTHHRIAVHSKARPAKQSPPGSAELKPVLDLERFGKTDRLRSLGLANLDMAGKQKSPELAAPYLDRAVHALAAVRDAGLRDSELLSALDLAGFLADRRTPSQTNMLDLADAPAATRCGMLFAHAYSLVRSGSPGKALPQLRELTRLRRQSTDWLLLAGCLQAVGDAKAAIDALETATRINPRLWQAHRQLADHFRQLGDAKRAAWHECRAIP